MVFSVESGVISCCCCWCVVVLFITGGRCVFWFAESRFDWENHTNECVCVQTHGPVRCVCGSIVLRILRTECRLKISQFIALTFLSNRREKLRAKLHVSVSQFGMFDISANKHFSNLRTNKQNHNLMNNFLISTTPNERWAVKIMKVAVCFSEVKPEYFLWAKFPVRLTIQMC